MNKFNDNSMFEEVFSQSAFVEAPVVQVATDKEAFCMLMASRSYSKQEFEDVVHMFSSFSSANMLGQFSKAIKDLDGYYDLVTSYSGVSPQYAHELLMENKRRKDHNAFHAARKMVWDAGQSAVSMTVDPKSWTPNDKDSSLVIASVSNVSKLTEHASHAKVLEMTNTVTAVVNTLPAEVVSEHVTDGSKRKLLTNIIEEFDEGVVSVPMDPKKFKVPTGAGNALPHTLSSAEYISIHCSAFIERVYGEDFIVAMRDKDAMQVSRYQGDNASYMIFNPEEGSPFNLDKHPAIYCDDYEDGDWKWRRDQKMLMKQASLVMQKEGFSPDKQIERARIYQLLQCEKALEYKGDRDFPIEFGLEMPYFGRVKEDSRDALCGKKYLLKFYKRGYSSLQEVEDNKDYIHVVSRQNAKTADHSVYYPVMLTDLISVILVPMPLWHKSRWARLNRGNRSLATNVGVRLPDVDLTGVSLYMTLFQLSHTNAMLRAWKAGQVYSIKEHTAKLVTNLAKSGDKNFRLLFPVGFANGNSSDRVRFLHMFMSYSPGFLVGLWIAPATSKQGKTGTEVIKRNDGFHKMASDYGDLDDYDPQIWGNEYDFDAEYEQEYHGGITRNENPVEYDHLDEGDIDNMISEHYVDHGEGSLEDDDFFF